MTLLKPIDKWKINNELNRFILFVGRENFNNFDDIKKKINKIIKYE